MAGSVEEEALHQLYLWIDNIPLSRPKRNLSRDFSDGGVCPSVCVRLCVHLFWPVCTVLGSVFIHVSLCLCTCGVCVCWGVSIS